MSNPIFFTDFYKVTHHKMYPKNMTFLQSNFTARASRREGIKSITVFGTALLTEFLNSFNDGFFRKQKKYAVGTYKSFMEECLGGDFDVSHLAALHDLGYLPIIVRALDEGTECPIGVPMMTIENTNTEFAWLVNYLETAISCLLWHPTTEATIAREYHRVLTKFARDTGDESFVPFQAHDFCVRGMGSHDMSKNSGMGHLLYFKGTDNIPSILRAKELYFTEGLIGTSVPASEHSVMCSYGLDGEFECYEQMLERFPDGLLSLVSDTYDLWYVIEVYLRRLQDKILARNGKLVIRPDSGDPEKIICGDPLGKTESARKGVVRLLAEIFGTTKNSKGYLELHPKIGVIYGDSITLERAEAICASLQIQGFATTNVVFGIGSYTYQYVTRDTFGFAMKATYCEVESKPRPIMKNPITDNGVKKSLKGYVAVASENGTLVPKVFDSLQEFHGSIYSRSANQLKLIFENGRSFPGRSFSKISATAQNYK